MTLNGSHAISHLSAADTEMIGRAPERDRQARPVESGQQAVEQRTVFERELARERYYGANATDYGAACWVGPAMASYVPLRLFHNHYHCSSRSRKGV